MGGREIHIVDLGFMWCGSSRLFAPYPKLVNANSFPLIFFFFLPFG